MGDASTDRAVSGEGVLGRQGYFIFIEPWGHAGYNRVEWRGEVHASQGNLGHYGADVRQCCASGQDCRAFGARFRV